MNGNANCPIWGTPHCHMSSAGGLWHVDSPRAGGAYLITREAAINLQANNGREKARLTSWLVEQRRLGIDRPDVTATTVEEAERRRRLSVQERADRLLREVSLRLRDVADTFEHNNEHPQLPYRLAWSESLRPEEVGYLLAYLQRSEWIERTNPEMHGLTPMYHITIDGHARLAALEQTNTQSSKAFVAMWLDESTNEAWEKAIKPGIEDAGYDPVRIDRKEHVNRIDDEIVAELRRARFIVADFTHGADGARGGVYYEAGFAHGRDILVVFCCRSDVIEKIHFDTRQYNHITWDPQNLDDFRRRLRTRIEAVIGEGPSRR